MCVWLISSCGLSCLPVDLGPACSVGKVRFGSGSGGIFPNAELELRFRFSKMLNPEPELAVQVRFRFKLGSNLYIFQVQKSQHTRQQNWQLGPAYMVACRWLINEGIWDHSDHWNLISDTSRVGAAAIFQSKVQCTTLHVNCIEWMCFHYYIIDFGRPWPPSCAQNTSKTIWQNV